MNIERRPVKAVKVTVYTLLVILGWLAIGFVELDSIKYFGLLRYEFISDITLIHDESRGCLDIPTVPHTYIPMAYRDIPRPMYFPAEAWRKYIIRLTITMYPTNLWGHLKLHYSGLRINSGSN